MSESDPRPLWEVMQEAMMYSCIVKRSTRYRECIAAEIEALADAVVPEEPPIERTRHTMHRWVRRDERQTIRRHLLAEAERAREGRE